MSEFAYPLDGEQNYTAAQCGAFFAGRSSGVFSAEENLAVSVTGARQLTLSAGIAWVNTDRFWGKVYCNTDAINFVLPTADGVLDMICRVVIRWNKTTNECRAMLLEGAPSSSPVAPARSTTDELYDLVLADYLVQHGETEASAARLTDQRLNEDLCGLMRDNVTRIPTDHLQQQAEDLIEYLLAEIAAAEGGALYDLKPVRAENVTIAPAGFTSLSPAGAEEQKLFDLGYEFRAAVPVSGVLSSMFPTVVLSLGDVDAAGVGIANQFACYNGGVYIYADGVPETNITALTIECRKAVS